MIPAFLITFREVIEASLIVVTILGILTKLNQINDIKTVKRKHKLCSLKNKDIFQEFEFGSTLTLKITIC
jgi:high-affinity Fe2+/Pb2+ permease